MKAARFLAIGAILCGCAGAEGESKPVGKRVALAVAPLQLPGVGRACFDIIVVNGDGETVWARGNPAQSKAQGDPSTLCSDRYGSGGSGDIAFVGPCDASAPEHQVTVWVDSLWTEDLSETLGGWTNPCPYAASGASGCTLGFTCVENRDAAVTFSLTIMRAADQGFFDVAVNFDDVFCSAKLDCSYDTAGQTPVRLLFHEGDRDQTAVLALACTAGPSATDETALHLSHVRFRCGGPSPFLFSDARVCYGGTNASEDRLYGLSAGAVAGDFRFEGTAWQLVDPDGAGGAPGAYVPSVFDPTDGGGHPVSEAVGGVLDFDAAALMSNMPGAANGKHVALCGLLKKGTPPAGVPYPIEAFATAICTEDSATGAWGYVPLERPAGWAFASPAMTDGSAASPDFLVTAAPFESNGKNPGLAAVYRYQAEVPSGLGAEDYLAPVVLPLPVTDPQITGCRYLQMFDRIVVGVCPSATGNDEMAVPHIWQIQAPGAAGPAVLLDNPGTCSGAGTPCNTVADCAGGESCACPEGQSCGGLAHIDPNFAGYLAYETARQASPGLMSVQTLGTTAAPVHAVIANVPYAMSGTQTGETGHRTVVYAKDANGHWAAAAPELAAAGTTTYADAAFEVVRGGDAVVAAGRCTDIDGSVEPPQASSRGGVFRYNAATANWDVFASGISLAGDVFGDIAVSEVLVGGLVVGTYLDCHPEGAGCTGAVRRVFAGVLPSDKSAPIPAVQLALPSGPGGTPLDASALQLGGVMHRASGVDAVTARFYLNRTPEGSPDALIVWDVSAVAGSATVVGSHVLDATDGGVHTAADAVAHVDLGAFMANGAGDLADPRWDAYAGTCGERAVVSTGIGENRSRSYLFDVSAATGNSPTRAAGWDLAWPSWMGESGATYEEILDLAKPRGNVWSPEHTTSPLWQYAVTYGNETLACAGESCNKRYVTVALGFDPSEAGCWVHFDATASRSAEDFGVTAQGVPTTPANTAYPVIHYAVKLTGDQGGLECHMNPLNAEKSGVWSGYTAFEVPQTFCYAYDGTTLVNHCAGVSPQPDYAGDTFTPRVGGGGVPSN